MDERTLKAPDARLLAWLDERATGMAADVVGLRRDLHRHAEPGWCEFRTAALVAERLRRLGWRVRSGAAAVAAEHRRAVPPDHELEVAWERARAEGAPTAELERLRGGLTGVVADWDTGRPGPCVAVRVDMDALNLLESEDRGHRPAAEGWASRHRGAMHACGHDGHTAMGLALAEILPAALGGPGRDPAIAGAPGGRVRLIFQPAEEGGRGARSMVAAGAVEGVDALICTHLGLGVPTGQVVAGAVEFLASVKWAVRFRGVPAHAGLEPERGRDALLAAASATLAVHALPRHSGGRTRVNVGVLHAGTAANIVPGVADMQVEVRSDVDAVQDELARRALAAIHGAAAMYGVEVEAHEAGAAAAVDSHPRGIALVQAAGAGAPGVRDVQSTRAFGASEDATYLMGRVHAQGGYATYALIGADTAAGHHHERFDFDEAALPTGVAVLARSVVTALCQ